MRRRVAGACGCALVLLLGLLALGYAAPASEQVRYATWDQFFYKAQLPLPAAAPEGRVTLLVYHSYPGPLHDVRLMGRSEGLTVLRQPAPRAQLDPTEIVAFPMVVRRREGATGATASLEVELHARELPAGKTIALTVPLTAQAAQELQQQLTVPVGAMEVRVGGFGNQVYVLYLLPMLALLAWWGWRRRRLARG